MCTCLTRYGLWHTNAGHEAATTHDWCERRSSGSSFGPLQPRRRDKRYDLATDSTLVRWRLTHGTTAIFYGCGSHPARTLFTECLPKQYGKTARLCRGVPLLAAVTAVQCIENCTTNQERVSPTQDERYIRIRRGHILSLRRIYHICVTTT